MYTVLAPAVLPPVGPIPVTVGMGGGMNVYLSANPVEDVPLGVVTVMSTWPIA
jgi:hypothetical protein